MFVKSISKMLIKVKNMKINLNFHINMKFETFETTSVFGVGYCVFRFESNLLS